MEHSLLGGMPEAALKLEELKGQIAQNVARAAQAEEEQKEHIEHVYAALKVADTAESSKPMFKTLILRDSAFALNQFEPNKSARG